MNLKNFNKKGTGNQLPVPFLAFTNADIKKWQNKNDKREDVHEKEINTVFGNTFKTILQ